MPDPTAEVTDLLSHLIRNACVNDGSVASGQEVRSSNLLASYLDGAGPDLCRYESAPGRGSLVTRIEGSDPQAPSLLLMGHLDVVPVNADRWQRDPFGGEVVDGYVWGRGAIDMLSQTAAMAVAVRRLAARGFRPRGTLTYAAVADEEMNGEYGAEWLLAHQPDTVRADYVLTETGGYTLPLPARDGGRRLAVTVAEKGSLWARLLVSGTPGHASMPLRTDNALVNAARVVQRLAEYRPATRIDGVWREFVARADLPADVREMLLDPARVDGFVRDESTDLGMARMVHACTHTTIAPTVGHGGSKTNVIPDLVELQVDVRTLPGQGEEEVRALLAEAIGPDLAPRVDIVTDNWNPATASPVRTPLWESLTRVSGALVPGAGTVPFLMVGATDARFFRRAGATAYGYGMFSDRIGFAEFGAMFHGDNERIDQESLRLSTELWEAVVTDFLG
ncbi:MAG TPA: M20/M25/M40 family metallo-hydrolase [Rugosimonospora sp.]|nr:M20/M25/M40 family metallo-hydrolase [Rugosimonospora sp.]